MVKIGILGTGWSARPLGTKFAQPGHQVKMGSRTANNDGAIKWVKSAGPNASQGTFGDAAVFGEMVFICLKGAVFLDVTPTLKPADLGGKILIDVSNPLDFSRGMPPSLLICNASMRHQVEDDVDA